jgi:NAD(P)-dependent dehydrogenase (short-subunit alcohol dehydrogenase family)
MKLFKDKVAIITGAASGIGRGLAERCAQEGMKVVLADIEAKALFETEDKMKKTGATVMAVLTDVSKASDVQTLAQKTIDTFGAVHLLCNNAGVGIVADTNTWNSSLADWKWVMGVNLWGVINGIRTFIPIMIKQDTICHIVNTSSLAGLVHGGGIYGVTKHAIVALSESLAIELAQNKAKIKVSVLCPGYVSTRILDCERNRPVEFKNAPTEIKSNLKFEKGLKIMRHLIATGIACENVADIVFQAIRNEKFYILTHTHPSFKFMVKRRMGGILKAFKTTN